MERERLKRLRKFIEFFFWVYITCWLLRASVILQNPLDKITSIIASVLSLSVIFSLSKKLFEGE